MSAWRRGLKTLMRHTPTRQMDKMYRHTVVSSNDCESVNTSANHFTKRKLKLTVLLLLSYVVFTFVHIQWSPVSFDVNKTTISVQHKELESYANRWNTEFYTTSTTSQKTKRKNANSVIPKIILQWTQYFSSNMFFEETYSSSDMLRNCPMQNCRFTMNKREFGVADVVLFHGPDLTSLNNYPEDYGYRRRPNQLYLYENMESPATYPFSLQQKISMNYFNITMSYRRDSDILKTYADIADFPAFADVSNEVNYFKLKKTSKIAVMYVSNECQNNNASNRIPYALRLQEILGHGRVDIFGACTKVWGDCPRNGPRGCMRNLQKYFFYLAFENSMCDDYVTEKLYRAFYHRLVPVVNNHRVNYDLHAPRGSYIHTRDFKNASDLAVYLERVAHNEILYNQYMIWRRDAQTWLSLPMFKNIYGLIPSLGAYKAACNLCALLNNQIALQNLLNKSGKDQPKVIADLGKWWSDGHCEF